MGGSRGPKASRRKTGTTSSYDAFVSYSHAADGRLAPGLQATLQRYAKPWYRRRALRVFRDQTGLSANPHLWTSIVEALDGSRWFILLSSPDAARSEWVGKEIAHWVEHKGSDHILPVVTDGTWAWDPVRGDLARASTAAHPALFGVFAEEPRHVDLAWAHSEVQVDVRDGRFLDAVAELAAPLRGVPKDELAGEEVRQHRRTVRTAWSAASAILVLLVVALVAAGLAVGQRNKAEDRQAQAERQTVVATARGLAAQAIAQAPVQLDLSLLLGVEGVRRDRSPDTTAGLLAGLNGAAQLIGFRPEFQGGVQDLEMSPDGDRVAAVNADGRIRLFETGTWRLLNEGRADDIGHPYVSHFVPEGLVVIGDRGAAVLALPGLERTGEPITPAGLGTDASSLVVVAPDGARAAVATFRAQPNVEIRDVATGAVERELQVPCPTGLSAMEWTPGGDAVAASCEGLDLVLLDPGSGAVIRQSGGFGAGGGSVIQFSPDGQRIALSGFQSMTVFDRTTLEPVAEHLPIRGGRPGMTRFSPDGQQLAIGGDDGSVLVWDLAGNQRLGEIVGLAEAIVALAVLPSTGGERAAPGMRLLVGTQSTVSEWNLSQSPALAEPVADGVRVLAVDSRGTRLEALADGRGFRLAGPDGAARRDVRTPGAACSAVLSPDGRAAVVSWFQPGAAPEAPLVTELRRLSDGAVVQSLSQEQGGGTCYTKRFAFSPDGRRLASVALDGNAAVWDVSDGRLVASGRLEPNVITLGWSPDSRLVVTGGISGQLRMWDPAHRLRSDATVALSDNSISGVQPIVGGDRLVATVESGEIWVVDLGDEETVGPPFRWGGTQLQSGALSPDGRLLAAVSRDGTLRLWDARRHAVLGPALHAFERGDQALVTFTGSNELVGWDGVGLNAGQALRWHVDVDTWIDTACRLAGRPLTEEEWSRYIPEEPFAPACGEP